MIKWVRQYAWIKGVHKILWIYEESMLKCASSCFMWCLVWLDFISRLVTSPSTICISCIHTYVTYRPTKSITYVINNDIKVLMSALLQYVNVATLILHNKCLFMKGVKTKIELGRSKRIMFHLYQRWKTKNSLLLSLMYINNV